ncbi:MAG: glycosyltransferase [Alphaproteobacteria bacterium]|nr:glycosyltransferase [Alphaproteobacteria bacterium]MBV9586157.1 glycosyltransferase [Alphaproteobacteria bacterium]
MAALLGGAAWATLIGWLLLRLLRQFRTHRNASLGRSPVAASLPPVAIIVPARNEIANIETCLKGLREQRGLTKNSSIIIVDDGSQDGTAEAVARIAREDARISLIEAGDLPAGWMGKPHACWQGASQAKAEWLCFIDADVRATPDLVGTALAAALQQRLDMLSLNPLQELGGFWERLIIPAGLVLIGCVQDLRPVNDPASPEIAVNGQFLLIRRAVYFAVGGHAAARNEIAEDKALAVRVKRAGFRYRMLGAEHLARTRMYRGLGPLWEGLAKNATEILGNAPNTVAAATAALIIGWAAILIPVLAAISATRQPTAASIAGAALALLATAAAVGIHIGAARYFRIPPAFGLLFAGAYSAVAALAWRSFALRRAGHVTWKGRTYALQRRTSPGQP